VIAAMGKGLQMRIKIGIKTVVSDKTTIYRLSYYLPVDSSCDCY
jgi:hypothetical protein